MAIVYKYLPKQGYTKLDNKIFTIDRRKLSDGAKVLYGFLAGLRTGSDITDNYIIKSLDISDRTLNRHKKELKELDLLLVERVGLNQYKMYIGYTYVGASVVKQFWKVKDDGSQTTQEELDKFRETFTFDVEEVAI